MTKYKMDLNQRGEKEKPKNRKPSAKLFYGCPDPLRKKKKATKEQTSLAASLRTSLSFTWSTHSLGAASSTAAHSQTGAPER